jgi:hypothetical protein
LLLFERRIAQVLGVGQLEASHLALDLIEMLVRGASVVSALRGYD